VQTGTSRGTPPMTLLLRRPAQVVRHHVLAGLRESGFDDILPAHLGVFQHPGPDGVRPGVLAARNQASKQAMNHLLHQLEEGGYLVRRPHTTDRRTRVVKLTDRGWAALEVMRRVAIELEQTWADALGDELYRAVRTGLARLEHTLEESLWADGPPGTGGGGRRTASESFR
jgi:DNA-binding MarR family transcriptional regulator